MILNTPKRVKNIFLYLSQSLVLGIVFLIPLYFCFWTQTANVYELYKIVLFRVLVGFLAVVVIGYLFLEGADRSLSAGRLTAKNFGRRFLFWPTVFLLTLSVATILSINLSNSFFGSYARQQGLVSYLFYFLFFILVLFVLRSEWFVKQILKTAVISSFFVCAYGLAQAVGFDPLVWNQPPFSYSFRIASSLGQPNFLASYLLLVIPLAIYFFADTKNFYWRFFYLIILLSQLTCLFLTYSRAGWLGFLLGAIAVGAVKIWELSRKSFWKKDFFPRRVYHSLFSCFCHPAQARRDSKGRDTESRRKINICEYIQRWFKKFFVIFFWIPALRCRYGRDDKGEEKRYGWDDKREKGRYGRDSKEKKEYFNRDDIEKRGSLKGDNKEDEKLFDRNNKGKKGICLNQDDKNKSRVNFLNSKKRFLFFGAVIVIGVVFLTFGFSLVLKNLDNDVFLKRRIASFVNLEKGSLPARIQLWRTSLAAIKKRPWWGYGLENQGEALIPYYSKEMSTYTGINIYPDRAHNIILDTWLAGGLAAVLALFALLVFLFSLLLSNIYRGRERAISYALLAALAGYFFSLLFGFSVVVDEVYFWLYLAIIISLANGFSLPQFLKKSAEPDSNLFFRPIRLAMIIILAIAAMVFAWQQGKALAADYCWRQIQEADAKNDIFRALSFYNHLPEFTNRSFYYEQAGGVFANWVLENSLPLYNYLSYQPLEEIKDKIKPHSFLARLQKAKVLTALASHNRPQYFTQAEAEFNFLFTISPQFPRLYYQAGRLQAKGKNYLKAVKYYQTALQLLPSENDWRLSREHSAQIKQEKYLLYHALAQVFYEQEKAELALKYFKLAFKNNPTNTALLNKLAQAAYLNGNFDKAIWYTRWGWSRQPNNYFWPQSLALIYEKMGDKDRAEKYREIADNLLYNLK